MDRKTARCTSNLAQATSFKAQSSPDPDLSSFSIPSMKKLTSDHDRAVWEVLIATIRINSEIHTVSLAMCIDRKVPGHPRGAAGQPATVGQVLKSPHSSARQDTSTLEQCALGAHVIIIYCLSRYIVPGEEALSLKVICTTAWHERHQFLGRHVFTARSEVVRILEDLWIVVGTTAQQHGKFTCKRPIFVADLVIFASRKTDIVFKL